MERKAAESGSCLFTGRVNRVTATVLNAGQQPSMPTAAAAPGRGTTVLRVIPPTSVSETVPQHPRQVLGRVLLKAVPRGSGGVGKNDGKVFTLRSVSTYIVSSCMALKRLIKDQLSEDIRSVDDFDIGVLEGQNLIRIRNNHDLEEAWDLLKGNNKATLWCDGLACDTHVKPSRKRASNSDADEATSTRTKRKKTQECDDRVQEIFDELKQAHSGKYTTMQLRIWAEMINSGMHLSTSDPPNTSMFNRAGGAAATPSKKNDQPTAVTQALANAATTIASALSPAVPSKASSPARVIDHRSKLYKQLSELRNLHTSGILTDGQYENEKECILELLQELRAK